MKRNIFNKFFISGRISSLVSFPKRRPVIFGIILVLIIIGGLIIRSRVSASPFTTLSVGRLDLYREVSVTGKIKASESVNLSFEQGGQLTYLVPEGSRVFVGQMVASLDSAALYAGLSEAKANLKTREAELFGLQSGTREEELSVERARLISSKQSLDVAQRNLLNQINDGYAKVGDIFNNKLAGLFYRSGNQYSTFFTTDDYALDARIKARRADVDAFLSSWASTDYTSLSASELLSRSVDLSKNLDGARSLIDDLNTAFNSPRLHEGQLSSSADYWRGIIVTNRTIIGAVVDGFGVSRNSFATAFGAYEIGSKQLALKEAGTSQSDLAVKEAQVQAARETVSAASARLAKATLRSPISGVVAKQSGNLWEMTPAGSEVVSIVSDKQFQIEADVPEADISKIAVGSRAMVTLDAYGKDVVFSSHIVAIDVGETIINNVTTYKTTFEFDESDDRIRSGMTANIDIDSGSKLGVVAIPSRAVISEDGRKFVKVLSEKKSVKIPVETGFKSSDGFIEIVSGLKEGDLVITAEKK